jgi:quercetin dioxygenase-like cupin family protein
MSTQKIILSLLLVLIASMVNGEELLRTTKTWNGGDIVYPAGKAEITSIKVTIEEGKTTPFHCHPVPTMGYILKGTVEVETKSGEKTLVSEGESMVEVLSTLHRGKAIGGPVEILVFYAGAESMPTTVLAADDPYGKYCNGVNH